MNEPWNTVMYISMFLHMLICPHLLSMAAWGMTCSGDCSWGHLQRTCDLILLSRAFCTSLTLCACLRMVAGAEARAGKDLGTHTHRLCCGGGVAEGMERELYPGTVHLVTLEVASYRLPDFLQKELFSSSYTAINLPNTVLNQPYLAIIATCCIL